MKDKIRRKVRRSYTVSTISMALVLFLLGSIGYAVGSIFRASTGMRSGVTMMVELDDELQTEERNALSEKLSQNPMVASLRFVSKDEKLNDEEFRKAFAVDIENIFNENPLPDSFDLILSDEASDRLKRDAFIAEVERMKGVNHVSYPEELLENMHSALNTLQLVLLLFGGTMLIISLILLGNTVRLAIFSQREIINTLKMVGATKWFIMKPMLAKSALQGLIAGLTATLLFGCALYGLNRTIPEMHISSQLSLIGLIAVAMIATGILLALLFTYTTVNTFVNMKSNKIHLY